MSNTPSLARLIPEEPPFVQEKALVPPVPLHTRPSGPYSIKKQNGTVELLPVRPFFVSSNPAMISIRQQIEKVANYDIPVLILGESGTGKEVFARLIHSRSPRASRPFLKVSCAALPASLLESELLGYERGAFTGAVRSNPGKFELCNTGTILLDEIGEIPPELQAKLLHVLQDSVYSRLGGDESLHADVRVIAATNVNISEALESGKLRRDLYYRLNAFTLRLPPLRSRKDEIPLLLEHFIKRFAADYEREVTPPSRRLTAACMEYPWPGNIRELQNFVQRLLIQGDEEEALKELQRYNYSTAEERAPVELNKGKEATPIDLKELGRQLKSRTERPTIEKALQKTRYNRKAAAQHLKISYKSLLLKLREYGLDGKHPLGGPDLAIEA